MHIIHIIPILYLIPALPAKHQQARGFADSGLGPSHHARSQGWQAPAVSNVDLRAELDPGVLRKETDMIILRLNTLDGFRDA